MTTKNGFLLLAILFCSISFGQQKIFEHRSLYVDNFANIIGSEKKQNDLFDFAVKHEVTSLILYDLNKINKRFFLGDSLKNQILANFIKEAKTKYGLTVSASGESGNFFIEAIHPYNVSRKDKNERFDIYNLEYEYWEEEDSTDGGYYCENYLKIAEMKCNRQESFKYYINSLEIMRLLANELDKTIEVEAYIGKFNKEEAEKISKHVDHLLIHDYVSNEYRADRNSFFPYLKERLDLLDEVNSKTKISILYSTESNYLGYYLKNHDFHEAEKKFLIELEEEEITLEQHLNLFGFAYYNYGYFKFAEKYKN